MPRTTIPMPRQLVRNFVSCLNSNGTTTSVAVSSSSSLQLTGSYTFTAWINPFTVGEGSNGRIIDKTIGTEYGFFVSGGSLAVAVQNGANAAVISTTVLKFRQWQHVAVSYDGVNATFYYNGELAGVLPTGVPVSGSNSLYIANRAAGDRTYDGLIDELSIYKGQALTQDQIKQIYYQGVYPTTGLSALWKFDEGSGTSAIDSSGNNNTGTISNGSYSTNVVMIPRTAAGTRQLVRNFVSCLSFNGTTAYVDVGTYGNLGSTLSSPFSLSCWINTTQITQASIVGTLNTGTNTLFQVNINFRASDGTAVNQFLSVQYRNESNSKNIRAGNTNAYQFNNGMWHHLVFTVEPVAQTSTLYVDGVSQAVTVAAGSAPFNGSANFEFPLTMGARNNRNTIDNFFTGRLDEIHLYNIVLFQAQVSQLYYQGVEPAASDLLGKYTLDENTGTTANDTSGAGNTGTLSGSPLPSWSTNVVMIPRTAA